MSSGLFRSSVSREKHPSRSVTAIFFVPSCLTIAPINGIFPAASTTLPDMGNDWASARLPHKHIPIQKTNKITRLPFFIMKSLFLIIGCKSIISILQWKDWYLTKTRHKHEERITYRQKTRWAGHKTSTIKINHKSSV